jgi:hypothetical protein
MTGGRGSTAEAARSFASILSSLVVAGILWGCSVAPPLVPPPAVPGIADHDRAGAMISVHAHARRPNRNFHGAPIMVLEDAVPILASDVGSAAASRRRRAIAKLAGYGLDRPDFRTAITQLGVDPAAIDVALGAIASVPAPGVALELLIFNLPLLVGLTPDCRSLAQAPLTAEVSEAVLDTPTGWSLDLLVPRPVHEVARALDPQSWDQCSVLFKATYLVETPTPCCSVNGPVTGCTAPAGPNDPPPGSAEPVGKPYGYSSLFEHFCVDNACSQCKGPTYCRAQFKNILCVKTWYDRAVPICCLASCADRYDVSYRLARSMGGELLGNENVGVTIDQGGLSVRRAQAAERAGLLGNDWSVVHVDKTLSYSSSFYSGALVPYLQALMDEIKGEVVEISCCTVAKECWLAPW